MRKCVILLLAVVATQVSAGTAWRWVDANGTVHYSDRPVPGAEEVYLPDATGSAARVPAPATAPQETQLAPPVNAAASEQTVTDYTRLSIASPAPDATLWNIEGTLEVTVDIDPALQNGHRVVLIIDGQRRNPSGGAGRTFTLNEVYRGQHTIQALVVDGRNATLIESRPVQFMVQQTSLQNPNRG